MRDGESRGPFGLTTAQIEQVVREADDGVEAGDYGLAVLLALGGSRTEITVADLARDERWTHPKRSRSLIVGLLVYARLSRPGSHRVTRVAAELGMSTTTALRYTQTLVDIGLLVQNPSSRRYGRA
jgi:predicted transcriptional regulator